jgi:hypothetical protein
MFRPIISTTDMRLGVMRGDNNYMVDIHSPQPKAVSPSQDMAVVYGVSWPR